MISALMPTYSRSEFAFERGDGSYLYDAEGAAYLDFAGGIAVTALGHNHPHLVAALVEQAHKLWHVSNLYRIPQAERLAERLIATCFADTVFFGNSGTEAVELAIKIVRRFHDANGNPERYRIITCAGAFHGRSLAALSAGGNEKHLAGFDPPVAGFDHVAFGNLNEMRAAIGPETAAIMLEPIQGEGGIRVASGEYLRGLRDIADEFGLLLVFDEVQCGMGRSGRLWAHEWAGVAPDLMTAAKGLGCGFPIGAVLATERAAACMGVGTHGSTFGGNPLATAVGNAVLDVMLQPGFLDHVRDVATRLRNGMQRLLDTHPQVFSELRGQGLLVGFKCVPANTDVLAAFRRHKILAVTAADNVIRMAPPLIIGQSEIDAAVSRIDAACRELRS